MRFGLLGTGYWAGEIHGSALAAHDHVELVGVWGRDAAKATTLATRLHTRPYDDVDALIGDVDAIAIALPPDVQAKLALRSAQAGRHLLLDKPMALTTEAADQVVAAVERNSLQSLIFFTQRFRPEIEAFLLDAQAVGGWDGARVTMFASIFDAGSPYAESQWRKEFGGLWDIGPHALSMLVPVLGGVAEVTAVVGPHAATYLTLRHVSGAVSTVGLTLDAPPAAVGQEFVLHGEHGLRSLPVGRTTPLEAYGNAISALLANANAGSDHDPRGVRFGREVVAILEAAQRSRDQRRTIDLPATG